MIQLSPELHQALFEADHGPAAIAIAANGRASVIIKNHAREIEAWHGAEKVRAKNEI